MVARLQEDGGQIVYISIQVHLWAWLAEMSCMGVPIDVAPYCLPRSSWFNLSILALGL